MCLKWGASGMHLRLVPLPAPTEPCDLGQFLHPSELPFPLLHSWGYRAGLTVSKIVLSSSDVDSIRNLAAPPQPLSSFFHWRDWGPSRGNYLSNVKFSSPKCSNSRWLHITSALCLEASVIEKIQVCRILYTSNMTLHCPHTPSLQYPGDVNASASMSEMDSPTWRWHNSPLPGQLP